MKAAGTRASRSRVRGATVGRVDDRFPEGLTTPMSPIWDSTLQKTNEWLKALGRELGTSTGSRQLDVLGMLPAELKVLWPERLAAV